MDSNNWRVPRDPAAAGSPQQAGEPSSTWRVSRRPQRQPDLRFAERSRRDDLREHRPIPQQDDPNAADAIAEGRRIYLGNLQYQATPQDIEEFLATNGVGPVEKLHISVDPISGRNPGYCFLEFADRETAEGAMATLDGKPLMDREARARPCQPKGNNRQRIDHDALSGSPAGFNRWGDWGDRNANQGSGRGGPRDASDYFQSNSNQGRQLFVGGLPRMLDQAENELEMRSIFQGFEVTVVGKRISPKDAQGETSGRRNFCFVDFSTPEQAQAALEAVNGTDYRDAPLTVSMARGKRKEWSG